MGALFGGGLVRNVSSEAFADWGIPTAECIKAIHATAPTLPLIASGGLRNGLDIAKAIALGADLGGLALPFLQAADTSTEAVAELVQILMAEIQTVLFCTGNANLTALQHSNCLDRSR